jgi:thiol-disulfide isomerase/thioredoxin
MAVSSAMRELGWQAAPFELPAANPGVDLDGKLTRSLLDYASAEVVAVVFTCNHCPFAVHVEPELIRLATDYAARSVQLIAISANDPAMYEEDDFPAMARRAAEMEYPFPYLFDESQDVARAYGATCTPDVFVFGPDRRLEYRGRIDSSRPGRAEPTGEEIRSAFDALLAGRQPDADQQPSIGCSIKWRMA